MLATIRQQQLAAIRRFYFRVNLRPGTPPSRSTPKNKDLVHPTPGLNYMISRCLARRPQSYSVINIQSARIQRLELEASSCQISFTFTAWAAQRIYYIAPH